MGTDRKRATFYVAVVDDQSRERQMLIRELTAWFRGRGELVLSEYENGASMLREFRPGRFQIAFLDIRMEDMDGISLAKKLRESDSALLIVFLTSAREYAFDAFPVHPFDYLLKPCAPDALSRVLTDAVRLLSTEEPEITLRIARSPVNIPLSRILSASSQGHSVEVITSDGNSLRTVMTFADFSALLGGDERFLVCNRGLIINMDHVLTVEGEAFCMTDGSICPMRTKGKAELTARFAQYQISRMKRGAR